MTKIKKKTASSKTMALQWNTTTDSAVKNTIKHINTALRDIKPSTKKNRMNYLFEVRDKCNNLIKKERRTDE